jgi:hypothetical protein
MNAHALSWLSLAKLPAPDMLDGSNLAHIRLYIHHTRRLGSVLFSSGDPPDSVTKSDMTWFQFLEVCIISQEYLRQTAITASVPIYCINFEGCS